MQIINLNTVNVDTTAGGTFLLTSDQALATQARGMTCVVVNPSVDIALVDASGTSPVPPGVAGTYANSPLICPAGVPTTIAHRAGPMKAISSSGTATVKVAVGY